MSILAWRDALAVPCISRLFPADKRGDWPDCLTPGQAAALQRPYVAGDTQGRRQMDALALVIKEACLSGALPCGEEVKDISLPAPPVRKKNPFASAEWLSEFSPQSIASPQLGKKKQKNTESILLNRLIYLLGLILVSLCQPSIWPHGLKPKAWRWLRLGMLPRWRCWIVTG